MVVWEASRKDKLDKPIKTYVEMEMLQQIGVSLIFTVLGNIDVPDSALHSLKSMTNSPAFKIVAASLKEGETLAGEIAKLLKGVIKTEEDKMKYVTELGEKLGVDAVVENFVKNPGRRALAKFMLNNFCKL